ncbi:hypothetical protein [Fimbriiglobus ruber]|uniref:Uncharacterized protein n=1 Tax=Fimbriiglobus ruber TaxID=1908690 RepID=A0A225DJB3_9BACT|nr:hypothetical protein [Fimbriiglobus ruber]OWK41033.1 hypothetical protein FRUB_04925 [Fimbriiglobus ruber]
MTGSDGTTGSDGYTLTEVGQTTGGVAYGETVTGTETDTATGTGSDDQGISQTTTSATGSHHREGKHEQHKRKTSELLLVSPYKRDFNRS